MMCNNPKLDLVIMNAYIKFGKILPIASRDIHWTGNFGINKGQLLWYKFLKKVVQQSQARSCQYECIYKIC